MGNIQWKIKLCQYSASINADFFCVTIVKVNARSFGEQCAFTMTDSRERTMAHLTGTERNGIVLSLQLKR